MSGTEECQRVKVGVRIRPLGEKELVKGAQSIINVRNGRSVHTSIPSRHNAFNFDWAFAPTDSQSHIYQTLCAPILENLFDGVNATVLACKFAIT